MTSFTIMTINDREETNKRRIRKLLPMAPELFLKWYDASDPADWEAARQRFSAIPDNWEHFKKGELGVWWSNLSAWDVIRNYYEPVLVMEDDVRLVSGFPSLLEDYMRELPPDWDVFAIYTPQEQYGDYNWNYIWNSKGQIVTSGRPQTFVDGAPWYHYGAPRLCKAFQGYSCVANMYSPAGAQKLWDKVHEVGIYMPVDCWVWEMQKAGVVNGYSIKPGEKRMAEIAVQGTPTTIHKTERIWLKDL